MSLHIYKISEYDHRAETRQFDDIVKLLKEKYSDTFEECHLIGNYNMEGVEADALLICESFIKILEFKNWGGKITATENGSWKSGDKIIEGGANGKSPYKQAQINRSRINTGIKNIIGKSIKECVVDIIFFKPAEINNQLSDTVRKWLTICDNPHLDQILKSESSNNISRKTVRELIDKMNLGQFEVLDGPKVSEIGENSSSDYQETATNYFNELSQCINFVPDYAKVYDSFSQVFTKIINQKTNFTHSTFVGPFAKTDYLLRENDANTYLQRTVNDARVRIRKREELSSKELESNHLYDFQSLCEFISLIFKVEIPKNLKDKFPPQRAIVQNPSLIGEYIRMKVNNWDDQYIYGLSDSNDSTEIKVLYSSQENDWSYIADLLTKDSQLNIIRPREENGIIYPELIIFEPDYLVDISSIASCFEDYGPTPHIHLLNKIKPFEYSQSITLGNFAGQLLDEAIQNKDRSYKDSVMDFFEKNTFEIMATNIQQKFHSDAIEQKSNIHNAIKGLQETVSKDFDADNVIVEPSFFSEMLGLQGRMDFLQLDYKVLLEQKSGKCGWPQSNHDIPVKQEKHYVQMLLYMLLLKYNFSKDGKGTNAFLLYSKYSKPLLGLGPAPELTNQAIMIRNEIVWYDLSFANGGFKILDELSADKLNEKKISGTLWKQYKEPEINDILETIHKASDLERSYYYRFLTFIEKEHLLSKVGNRSKDGSGLASIWQASLEDKHRAGTIYDRLKLIIPEKSDDAEQVVLKFHETPDNDIANFRTGDIVILYPYEANSEPDARKTMVIRCTIEDIDTDKIALHLRSPQSSSRIFRHFNNNLWAIEHDFLDSSYSSKFRGMQAFLSAPKSRKDLILFQQKPEIREDGTLKGNYGGFNDLVAKAKKAKDFFLVIGPPGTGKTSFGLMNIMREALSEPSSSVLLLAYTNRAVDEICKDLKEKGFDGYIRIGSKISCAKEYRNHLLESIVHNLPKMDIDGVVKMVTNTRIFVATTASMNNNLSLFKLKQFNLAIVDEASQILEPDIIGILSAQNGDFPAIRKFVLIGDHKQLPAVVQQMPNESAVLDPQLQDIGVTNCRNSLFERLLNKYEKDDNITYLLRRQGRMHQDIAAFPNYAFYQNSLLPANLKQQEEPLSGTMTGENGIDDVLSTRRVAFFAVRSVNDKSSDKVNQPEADVIAATIYRIYLREKDSFKPSETIGVIVPYRNQIATIRKALSSYDIPSPKDITIDTVERFQGSQRDYIIYGFTIKKYYQLNFLTSNVFVDKGFIIDRKLNVALTRAMGHLIIVGNPELLNNDSTFSILMEFIKERQGFFDIPVQALKSGKFEVPLTDHRNIDISQATFTTSDKFNEAFNTTIMNPIKSLSGDKWPDLVLGRKMEENLVAIRYGRINFSNELALFEDVMSPQEQVLLYCYYIMRMHYCSIKSIFSSFDKWIRQNIEGHSGRPLFIDIGCGPATCGIAFYEQFQDIVSKMSYIGVDVSTEMKNKGQEMLNDVSDNKLNTEFIESFNELDESYWDDCSAHPSCIIFNFSYFFSNMKPQLTEQLGRAIIERMKLYPLNKYIFIIQHSQNDAGSNSFLVFNKALKEITNTVKAGSGTFNYSLKNHPRSYDFCYEILER